jgi:hypothetical protein
MKPGLPGRVSWIESNCFYEVIPKGSLKHQLKEGDPDDANIVIGPK